MSTEVIGRVILHAPPLCVILIHTHKKLSKRIRCMTEFRFSPSFLNRKRAPHLPVSACFPVCAALLSLLLAPALGRKSPTAQCTITSVPYISHENRHYFECLFGKHRQRGPRFMFMLTVARSFSLSELTKQRARNSRRTVLACVIGLNQIKCAL